MSRKIFVIGLDGETALNEKARGALLKGEVVLASGRLLELFSGYREHEEVKARIKTINKIEDTLSFIRGADGAVSVLASGDPLFFGIGTRLLNEFPSDEVHLYPALSSMQTAFSKIKMNWEDAFFISLHGNRVVRDWKLVDLPLLCELHRKLVILTGGGNTPSKISEYLPESSHIHLFERLGYPDEKITEGDRVFFLGREFAEPNLMIVKAPLKEGSFIFGLKETDFAHERGLITKDEVRAVILHKLALPRKGVLWDIGAGSGSVSIEAKRLSPGLEVYAIEKDAQRVEDIKANIRQLRAGGVNAVHGEAPEILDGLPSPDCVFIGGAGDALKETMEFACKKMNKGVLAAAIITLESLGTALGAFRENGFKTEVCSVSVSRGEEIGEKEYMKALNPVFILKGTK